MRACVRSVDRCSPFVRPCMYPLILHAQVDIARARVCVHACIWVDVRASLRPSVLQSVCTHAYVRAVPELLIEEGCISMPPEKLPRLIARDLCRLQLRLLVSTRVRVRSHMSVCAPAYSSRVSSSLEPSIYKDQIVADLWLVW